MMKKTSTKRPFVLLEVLVAFAIIATTILPTLHYPFSYMRKEIDQLIGMELEKTAHERLVLLEEAILLGNYDKELLESKPRSKCSFTKTHPEVITRGPFRRIFHRRDVVRWEKQKQLPDNSVLSLVEIEVNYYTPKNHKSAVTSAATRIVVQKDNLNYSLLYEKD